MDTREALAVAESLCNHYEAFRKLKEMLVAVRTAEQLVNERANQAAALKEQLDATNRQIEDASRKYALNEAASVARAAALLEEATAEAASRRASATGDAEAQEARARVAQDVADAKLAELQANIANLQVESADLQRAVAAYHQELGALKSRVEAL